MESPGQSARSTGVSESLFSPDSSIGLPPITPESRGPGASRGGSPFSPFSSRDRGSRGSRDSRGGSRGGSRGSRGGSLPAGESFELAQVSPEDLRLARLGFLDLDKQVSAEGAVFYREEMCRACGVLCTQPSLLHVYNACKACHCVLREPSMLRGQFQGVPQREIFEILFATYGDPLDADLCVDVTERVRELVRGFSGADRLSFKPAVSANTLFGDPYPGHNKQLRARYRIQGPVPITYHTS
ncbi:hypothetical protein B484DRAFT_400486 [Ochromonadaceae sp. CCMP2298]|nr:hypothetical protein B484DRAFT_400486 [Ochromonadaceae sp. CCMP2298]